MTSNGVIMAFVGHITLAYLEELLSHDDQETIMEILTDINRKYFLMGCLCILTRLSYVSLTILNGFIAGPIGRAIASADLVSQSSVGRL